MNAVMIRTLAFGAAIICTNAHSYEAETHGLITYQAYKKSVLQQSGSGSLINRLGFDRLDAPQPFHIYWNSAKPIAQSPDSYIDAVSQRQPNEYERCQIQHLLEAHFIQQQDPMVDASGTKVVNFPTQNWLLRGALREDDLSHSGYLIASDKCGEPEPDPNGPINRVLNHFYDPIHDTAFAPSPPLPPCSLVAPNGVCLKSVDWALGFVDSFAEAPVIDTSRRNHFTYEDARQNLWLALTGQPNRSGASANTETASQRETDTIDRYFAWATAFRSLGDTIHLLEDGAQPQHVRNDPHGPALTSLEQQAFEGYTNARVLQDSSKANPYIRNFFGPGTPISLPSIGLGDYPAVMFSTPLRFFTTRNAGDDDQVLPNNRYGMMDYANRSFFTGGTLPTASGNGFLEPSNSIDAVDDYTSVREPCALGAELANSVTNLTCSHWTHAVSDSVAPGYVDILPSGFTQPPLLQESVFHVVRAGGGITMGGSDNAVGIAEFQVQSNLTIPRAIGYTAGLLNYFFRGQIAITPPPAGLFAILDHGRPHTVDADGYPRDAQNKVFGYQQVQLKLRNATPDITESGTGIVVKQRMAHGQLVAAARYHRNTCYKPDLSGELGKNFATGELYSPPSCNVHASRSPYQEIAVSASLAVDANGLVTVDSQALDVNGTAPILATFDFSSDPIPVNATDLFLQIVYRGNMGDTVAGAPMIELDAIAVGTVDVSEPTYYFTLDGTDYFQYQDQWLTPTQAQLVVPTGTDVSSSAMGILKNCIDGNLVLTKGDGVNQATAMPATASVRYSAIFDITAPHYSSTVGAYWVNNVLEPQFGGSNPFPVRMRTAQAGFEKDPGAGSGSGTGAYVPNPLSWNRSVMMGSRTDNYIKSYDPYPTATVFPQYPLPSANNYLPVLADAVYLNNPNSGACNPAIVNGSPATYSEGASAVAK